MSLCDHQDETFTEFTVPFQGKKVLKIPQLGETEKLILYTDLLHNTAKFTAV